MINHKVKQGLVIGLTLIIFASCVVSYQMGSLAKVWFIEYQKQVDKNKFALRFKILNYHQGWFNSDAVLSLTKPPLTELPLVPQLQYVQIQHGPFLFKKDYTFGRAYIKTKMSIPYESEVGLDGHYYNLKKRSKDLQSETIIDLSGNAHMKTYSPTYQVTKNDIENKPKESIQVRSTQEDLKINKDFSKLDYAIKTKGSNLVRADTRFEVGKASLKANLDELQKHNFIGKADIRIDTASVSNEQGDKKIKLDGANIRYYIKENKNKIDGKIHFYSDAAEINGELIGRSHIDFKFYNMEKYIWDKVHKYRSKWIDKDLTEQKRSYAKNALFKAIPALISQKMKMDLNANIEVAPHARIILKGKIRPDVEKHTVMNIHGLNRYIAAEADLAIPEHVFKYVVERIERNKLKQMLHDAKTLSVLSGKKHAHDKSEIHIMAQGSTRNLLHDLNKPGFLTLDKGAYRFSVSYIAGSMYINGRPLHAYMDVYDSHLKMTRSALPQMHRSALFM